MSPKVKGYTDIYDILTYTGTETHVSFGLFIPEIHFFRQGLKNFLPPKGLRAICLLACLLLYYTKTSYSSHSVTVYRCYLFVMHEFASQVMSVLLSCSVCMSKVAFCLLIIEAGRCCDYRC